MSPESAWEHPRTLTDRARAAGVDAPRRREGTISNLLRRNVGNLPIRVPTVDWAKVVTGEKHMFRTYCARATSPERPVVPPDTVVPRSCLLYAVRFDGPGRSRRWEATPGVLLSHRQEPLGAITPEDLEAEGFKFLPAFRFYWKQRYRKFGWRPWDMVSVLEVRPWNVGVDDLDTQGRWLLEQLYGEWFGA